MPYDGASKALFQKNRNIEQIPHLWLSATQTKSESTHIVYSCIFNKHILYIQGPLLHHPFKTSHVLHFAEQGGPSPNIELVVPADLSVTKPTCKPCTWAKEKNYGTNHHKFYEKWSTGLQKHCTLKQTMASSNCALVKKIVSPSATQGLMPCGLCPGKCREGILASLHELGGTGSVYHPGPTSGRLDPSNEKEVYWKRQSSIE